MQSYFIKKTEVKKLFEFLTTDFEPYIIKRNGEHLFWRRLAQEKAEDAVISEYRPAEPLKGFLYKSKEKILDCFKDAGSETRPLAVIGAKACDLHSLKVLDYVFMEGDFKDPFYIKMRRESLIISSNCTSFRGTCFCLGVGVEPFPEENFDLNFAEMENGFIVSIGSGKGEKALKDSGMALEGSGQQDNMRLSEAKAGFRKRLKASIDSMSLPPKESLKECVRSGFKSEAWKEFSKTCVECGACNTICPTCHCFLLIDQNSGDKYRRLKIWDSCLLKRFARVAGGANPRKHLEERLRNRFIKKFDFFPEVLGMYACTGCGRCIEACPGDIDIREALKELAAGTKKPETRNQKPDGKSV